MKKFTETFSKKSQATPHPLLGNGRSAERQFKIEMFALRRFLRAGHRTLEAKSASRSRRSGGRGRVRTAKDFSQRVLVKARVVKARASFSGRILSAHLKYLARSGVSFEGAKPDFYCEGYTIKEAELSKFVRDWAEDSH